MNDRGASGHPDRETLHRHAEGDLQEQAAGRVDEHLEACPRCRRDVEAIRELLRRAAALPRGIEPPRDLWAGVEARVRARRLPDIREATPWLAAAASLLVAVTAGATLWLAGGTGGASGDGDARTASTPGPTGAASPVLMEAGRVEAGYRPMVDRLDAVLESRKDRLPPEAREVVEGNLRIIDAAIAEAESALAANPASPELLRALDRSHRKKIDLLRRSVRLTAQM